MKELIKFLQSWIWPLKGSAEITIVRRYKIDSGWIGELYLDGKQLGMTCDSILESKDFKQYVETSWTNGHRVLKNQYYLIDSGPFINQFACDIIRVGSIDPKENDLVLGLLLDKVQRKQFIRMTVLTRKLVEF